MKLFFVICTLLSLLSCDKADKKKQSIELITSQGKQDSIFHALLSLTNNLIPENKLNDSLAFLILPVQASCPSCRKKTIDSIVKHQLNLTSAHYIIISANGGRKTINSYFIDQEKQLPVIKDRLFLDTTNQAHRLDLYHDKPTIYYTHHQKAYKKVAAIPATVREDLREFFSGSRINNNN